MTVVHTTAPMSEKRAGYLRMEVGGVPVDCLLHTGSDISLIPAEMAASLDLEPSRQLLYAANGTPVRVLGKATIAALADDQVLRVAGLVSNSVEKLMMGIDWLTERNAI